VEEGHLVGLGEVEVVEVVAAIDDASLDSEGCGDWERSGLWELVQEKDVIEGQTTRVPEQGGEGRVRCGGRGDKGPAVVVIGLAVDRNDDVWDVSIDAPEAGMEIMESVSQHRVTSTIGEPQERHHGDCAVEFL
jgi:hypothetical protein